MLTDVNERELVVLPADTTPETVDKFRQSTEKVLTGGPQMLLLDCSRIVYMSSTHVGLMWGAYIDCEKQGVQLQLLNVSDQIRIVLRTLDLDTILLSNADVTQPIDAADEQPVAITTSRLFEDQVKLSKKAIQQGLDHFVTFVQTLGLRSSSVFELRLIYYEIVMNIKSHSGLGVEDTVKFEAVVTRSGITMTFMDTGVHFDPTAVERTITPEEAARSGRVRGFGLAMLKRVVDRITYAFKDNTTNVLTVEKTWG